MSAGVHGHRPPPRVALVGISGYGAVYLGLLGSLHARGELVLAAAAVVNAPTEPAAVASLRALGCEIFPDAPSLLAAHAGRLDLVCLPTGIASHAPLATAALAAGANVLLEKPLAGSPADAALILAAERAAGRFVAVGFQDLYAPDTLRLKAELLAGALGPLRSIRFLGLWPRTTGYYARNDWAGRLRAPDGAAIYDSPLNNAFAHFVQLGLFLAGPALHAAAVPLRIEAELTRSHAIASCDTAVARATLDTGVELFCAASHSSAHVRDPELVLEGAHGRAHWRYERDLTLTLRTGETIVRPLASSNAARDAMLAAVLLRLRDPAAPICDAAQASAHTAFIAAMHAASPILDTPRDRVTWLTRAGDSLPIPTVAGLEALLTSAWSAGRLPRELALAPLAAAS